MAPLRRPASVDMNINPWKPQGCEICAAMVHSQRELDLHNYLFHEERPGSPIGAPITFRCASCRAAFAERRDLLAHLAAHHGGARQGLRHSPRRRRRPLVT
jgi:hypothetical protein